MAEKPEEQHAAPKPAEEPAEKEGVRKKNPVQASQVQKDHLMAFVYYAKVKSRDGRGENLEVHGVDKGMEEFGVHGKALVEGGLSADYYAEEVPTTKTELARLLIESVNRPFTVGFMTSKGEYRALRGRLISPEPVLGRSYVEDLDIHKDDKKGRIRLVDHREIQTLVVDGVKYFLKGARR